MFKPVQRTNALHCLGFFCFLIVHSVLFTAEVFAGFCWSVNDRRGCGNTTRYTDQEVRQANPPADFDASFANVAVQSREGWRIELARVTYYYNDVPRQNPVNYEIRVNANNRTVVWTPANRLVITGYGQANNLLQHFKLAGNDIDALCRGNKRHLFVLELMGVDESNSAPKWLVYTIPFRVNWRHYSGGTECDGPPGKAVKISGLESVNFGTFLHSNFRTIDQQRFCAYVQGGGRFRVTASSTKGKQAGQFVLAGNGHLNQSIHYAVSIAGKFRGRFQAETIMTESVRSSVTFKGHRRENCNHNENMLLKLEIVDSQSSLSQKPADVYSDTLTLTIEAD